MTNTTTTTISDPRLPQDVVSLEEAQAKTDREVLRSMLDEYMKNGYWLTEVTDDGYVLEQHGGLA